MHLVGSLPWSLMRTMSGLMLAQLLKTTALAWSRNSVLAQLAKERLLSQLGLRCLSAEESMSLDGLLRQQL